MAKGTEIERAGHAAVRRYQEHIGDKRTADILLYAIEVRMGGAAPDVSLHVASGSQTQGGYLFFLEYLRAAVPKATTVM